MTKKKTKDFIIFSLIVLCLLAINNTLSGTEAEKTANQDIETFPCLVLKGTIIDGTGKKPLTDGIMVIQHGKITAVGQENKMSIPKDAHVISMPGCTILPGFINCHVHCRYWEGILERYSAEGVTTVRDLGGAMDIEWFQYRDIFNANPRCPRLLSCGPILTVPGGMPKDVSMNISSLDDAREKVNQLIDQGADVIKIAISVPRVESLNEEQVKVIVETAHQRGKPVAAHIVSTSGLRIAFEAGVDDINHLPFTGKLTDSMINRMIKAGIYYIPTLKAMPKEFRDKGIDGFVRYVKAGGKVAMGNDSGWLPNVKIGMPMGELLLMQEAGMTPMDIIKASTLHAAQVCRIEKEVGTLEKGKKADILVVRGNPLDQLENLLNTVLVLRNGAIIVNQLKPTKSNN